jgi:thiamine-phosphate pyrophosphorylase
VFDLAERRLYLCVGVRSDIATFLPAVLRGGVDVVQLREKILVFNEQRASAESMKTICASFGVPFIVNDSPEFALEIGADGVHVGQEDASVEHCRDVLGDESIIGLSTHATMEFDNALKTDATYFSAGPVEATPTKLGRLGTGLAYPVASQRRSDRPVFVTGGVTSSNVAGLIDAGLRHFVVVRALTESRNPETSARQLRQRIDDALSAVSIEPT